MATKSIPSQRVLPLKRKLAANASAEVDASRPFLRFYHSESLRKKTLTLLDTLEQAGDATDHRDAVADIVVELTSSGMDYYFMKPLKRANAGFLVQQSANLGMAGVQQVMATVIRQIIGRMDHRQLLSVSHSIRELML